MIAELILPFSLILPGLWMLQIKEVKINNTIERLSLSYILSLGIMFSLLYVGCILNRFTIAAFIYLAVLIISSLHLSVLFLYRVVHKQYGIKAVYSKFSQERLILILLTACLLFVYAIFLHTRAILDSDVVQEYLPIAREITRGNKLAYNGGYDYNILLKPIGISVLYAWTYVVSGSTLSENFRLMPLVPIILLTLLNYAIAFSTAKSKNVGIISTIIFLILPFHDRQLLYNAFYPDIFYYPLVFGTVYLLFKYVQSKRDDLLLWAGAALGVASLLKAQTIYIFIAFVITFLIVDLRGHKKLSVTLCFLTPFYILVPHFLAESVQIGAFRPFILSFTETQWALFLFLSVVSGVCCFTLTNKNCFSPEISFLIIKKLAKKIGLLLIPLTTISSLWYVNNLLSFGTFIWTSSINLPNYDWALEVLRLLNPVQQAVSFWHYLGYFIFMPIDPAVMGYILLCPFLIGLYFALRIENFQVPIAFNTILASVILSNVAFSLFSGYNPRDIFVLAPMITTLTAVGISSITSNFDKKDDNIKTVFTSLPLVVYFGALSYVHSVLVMYVSAYRETIIGNFASFFAGTAGLNLTQTSFQLPYIERAVFVGNNMLKIIFLSFIAIAPILILIIYKHLKFFKTKITLNFKHFILSKLWVSIKGILVFSVILVILIPRVEVFIAQGGFQEIKGFQLQTYYRDLHTLIVEGKYEFKGDILTFRAPNSLAYYFPGTKVIDLSYPANLAHLKNCLSSISTYETLMKLKQQGIKYLLINPYITRDLDRALNFTILKITQNPEYAILSENFGSWKLFTLGPYAVEKTFIPLSSWSVESRYTNASFILNSTASKISLYLDAIDINSRVTICHLAVPKLNLSEYDYVIIDLKGNDNARVLLRFFLDDGSSFDISYWYEIYTIVSVPFDLSKYFGRNLRGDAYISLKSSNGNPSTIHILKISFIKVKS